MITATALQARACNTEGRAFFLAGEASQIAFEILNHPGMPDHLARCQSQGIVFDALLYALTKGDENKARTALEQIFPGFSLSTVTGANSDSAGIMPDGSDEFRAEFLEDDYPDAVWAADGAPHLNVNLERWRGNTETCRVAVAVVIAIVHALELRAALAGEGEGAGELEQVKAPETDVQAELIRALQSCREQLEVLHEEHYGPKACDGLCSYHEAMSQADKALALVGPGAKSKDAGDEGGAS